MSKERISYSLEDLSVIGREIFDLDESWHCFEAGLTGVNIRYTLAQKDSNGEWLKGSNKEYCSSVPAFVGVALTDEEWERQWAEQKLSEVFEVDRFKKLGKENDHVFQALVFLSEASQKLSIARTILTNNKLDVTPDKMKEMLDMQNWLHDFKEYLRSK